MAVCTQYMIKFFSDLREVCGFLRVLRFHPQIKPTAISEILLKVMLNTITLDINYAYNTVCKKQLSSLKS
jgi:hypothetical protein